MPIYLASLRVVNSPGRPAPPDGKSWQVIPSPNPGSDGNILKGSTHRAIAVAIDRYGHLLPGGEAEATGLLDEYHARRQQEASRRQQRRQPAMV